MAKMTAHAVDFHPAPQYAVAMRLTPQLKQAMVDGHAQGLSMTVRFGSGPGDSVSIAEFARSLGSDVARRTSSDIVYPMPQVIRIGAQLFSFKAMEEETCELLRVPNDLSRGGVCTEAGRVKQRVHVLRNLDSAEGERLRARAEEAERQSRERTSQLLDKPHNPKHSKGESIVSCHTQKWSVHSIYTRFSDRL